MGIQPLLSVALSVLSCTHQDTELIKNVSEYFQFDHHFYVIDSRADVSRYVNKGGGVFTAQSLYILSSGNNGTELDKVREIDSKNTFLIVVLVRSPFDPNTIQLRQIKTIQRRQISMKIGVFFARQNTMEDLRTFFRWCKDNLIVNVFAVTYPHSSEAAQMSSCFERSINVFTFDAFGPFEVLNVTDSAMTYDGLFRSQKSNFHQYTFKVGIKRYFDYRGENLWETVFRRMNGTFTPIDLDLKYLSKVDDGFDILAYLTYQEEDRNFHVYPEKITHVVIIIPKALPFSEFSAYLRNAVSGEVFAYCLTSFVVTILVLSVSRYMKRKKSWFLQSVVDVCNILLNDNGNIKYQELSRPENFVIVPLTFVGIIFMSGMVSNLKSYLTRPVLQHQINTLDEIYASEFPIYAKSQSWVRLSVDVLSDLTSKNWSSKIFKGGADYINNTLMYSQNISFIDYPKFTDPILSLQDRLGISGYYKPDIRMHCFYSGYVVNETFLYFDRLNQIIDRMKSAGLTDLFERQEQHHIENECKKDAIRFRQNTEASMTGNNENFEFPTFVFYGWAMGLVLFIIELVWKHVDFPRINVM